MQIIDSQTQTLGPVSTDTQTHLKGDVYNFFIMNKNKMLHMTWLVGIFMTEDNIR